MKLLVGCLCVSGLLTPAAAQIRDSVEAIVPFAFHVGNTHLSAGRYLIAPAVSSGSAVEFKAMTQASGLSSVNAKNRAMAVVVPAGDPEMRPETSYVIFRKYRNEQYYVASIWSGPNGVQFHMSADERVTSRLVASSKPEAVLVAARLRH